MTFSTLKDADAIHGGLGKPSKMPGYAYGIPAKYCKVGSQLRLIPNSVCSDCYALKGRYAFKNVLDAQERRFASLNHPRWAEAIAWTINRKKCDFFRWHDSGDIQDLQHLCNIVRVALSCPGTKFWLPTREQKLVHAYLDKYGSFPKNLVVRMSGAMIDGDHSVIRFFRNTSSVTTDPARATCPAPLQGGVCGSCRACWEPGVRSVTYSRH